MKIRKAGKKIEPSLRDLLWKVLDLLNLHGFKPMPCFLVPLNTIDVFPEKKKNEKSMISS